MALLEMPENCAMFVAVMKLVVQGCGSWATQYDRVPTTDASVSAAMLQLRVNNKCIEWASRDAVRLSRYAIATALATYVAECFWPL